MTTDFRRKLLLDKVIQYYDEERDGGLFSERTGENPNKAELGYAVRALVRVIAELEEKIDRIVEKKDNEEVAF